MLKTILAAALALALPAAASAQPAYPSQAVSVIVPFTAGGTADIFARLAAEHLQKTWKQPFVVENLGGGGGVLAVQRIVRAKPDGATIGIASTSNLSIHPTLLADRVQYRTLRDLVPIIQVSIVPNVLVVNPARISAKSVPELIAWLKANPGKATFGSAGVGTTQHLAGELFQQLTGTRMVHVPYRGSSQMVTDLLGGQIDLAFDNVPLLLPHVQSGKLVALATATRERAPFDANLPAVSETVPGFEAVAWHGFVVPAGTPKEIVTKLAGEIGDLMRQPDTQRRFTELGATPVSNSSPEAFSALIASEAERWQKVIETGNIKPEN